MYSGTQKVKIEKIVLLIYTVSQFWIDKTLSPTYIWLTQHCANK